VHLPDGSEERIRSRYLIGCDGAHSAVRHAVGLPFEGTNYDSVVFLADVKIEGEEFVKSRITNFTSRRGFVSVLPFLGEYSRIFAVDFAKQHRAAGEELTLADLQDTVDAIVPMKLMMREPRWLTRFYAPSRQAPTNRAGRVFLAGDAAHAHSPAGGQGMNTGLQDAFNLSWKLAMVVHGEAPEELLASYDAEHHPVDARIQRETDMMLRSFLLHNPALKAARDLAARTLIPLRPVHRRLAGDLSGIGTNYRFTEGAREDRRRGLPAGALGAGDRVPDLELWDVRRPSVRLYELLREPGYALFVFASSTRLGAYRGSLGALVRSVNDSFSGEVVRPYVVLDEGTPDAVETEAPVLIDFKGQFRGKLGAGHSSVLLVRPDGYLAFHRTGHNLQTLSSALAPWAARRSSVRGQEPTALGAVFVRSDEAADKDLMSHTRTTNHDERS
jgi:hypothetical protein